MSYKTVLEHHRLIRTILNQAEKEMLVPYNAAKKATPPKSPHTEVSTLQRDEVIQILDALEKEPLKWRALIHLLIITGARRGEILGLHWNDINFTSHVIHIHSTLLKGTTGIYIETPKTKESTRYINIPIETANLLSTLKIEQDKLQQINGDRWEGSDFVFTRDNGLPLHPDTLNGWLNKFSSKNNLSHINPHLFRHTMASLLINSGTDILAISKRLGHSMTSTTLNFYGHIIQEADAKSSECIAAALLRSSSSSEEAQLPAPSSSPEANNNVCKKDNTP